MLRLFPLEPLGLECIRWQEVFVFTRVASILGMERAHGLDNAFSQFTPVSETSQGALLVYPK